MNSSPSASLSTIAQFSVGLTVCPMGDGYFVTAYRCSRQPDERRVSFEITTEEFLTFADEVSDLAAAERSGGDEERTGEPTPEPVGAA